ncbi:glycosyltransferase [Herbiconiux sp.]|uniref:glycosyltransferase n=1 Tax=Herbiconiux sp. TaxID=1871186 RepID=UPI0025C48F26|nr:glycosyltransferase [Herbiconiux sp.]
MIGYYVHHQGRGHASRAAAIAAQLDDEVTGLSSLPRPRDWPGDWVQLARDDEGPTPLDPTAGGHLHWAPLGDDGLRERMAAIAAWIDRADPSALVVDISVEVVALVRLLGVPVITFALPGVRDDPAHHLGYDLATTVLAAWPTGIPPLAQGLTPATLAKLVPVGAISRFAPVPAGTDADFTGAGTGDGRVLVLNGAGGGGFDARALDRARTSSPGWTWEVLGGADGRWSDDPWPSIRSADVVITHAGQNAIAEVAAARRPAIVLPQPRPHDEQSATATALAAAGYPVIALDHLPDDTDMTRVDWSPLLDRARSLPTTRWSHWNDGHGAERAARAIERVARHRAQATSATGPGEESG